MKNPESKSILNELRSMKDRMESLFSEVFEGARENDHSGTAEIVSYEPPVDIWETNHEYCWAVDLPGVDDEDLKVHLKGGHIEISGRRRTLHPQDGLRFSQIERADGFFSLTHPLPQNLKTDFINAELKRGVLTITIPKEESSKGPSVKIEVKSD